jgi:hypothetical protein
MKSAINDPLATRQETENTEIGKIAVQKGFNILRTTYVAAATQLVEALRYKPAGCGFDSQWCHWDFSLT